MPRVEAGDRTLRYHARDLVVKLVDKCAIRAFHLCKQNLVSYEEGVEWARTNLVVRGGGGGGGGGRGGECVTTMNS